MTLEKGALADVRILDLTDERGIYGAKLVADLGADVIRPEPPEGDPLRKRGPHLDENNTRTDSVSGESSMWHAFFASSRRFFTVDPDTKEGLEQIQKLVARSDIVLSCPGNFALEAARLSDALRQRPELIVIDVTSFGPDGPWKDLAAPDLVAGALGGFCATTGDVDTPPLKGFGELNFMVSGAYVAIAALAALHRRREHGTGQQVDVSVHECIASCLEHVFMCYWYDEFLPATIPALPRRASLHWSNAYVVMQALKGSVMVTPAPDFGAQLAWLVEVDAFEDLLDEKYANPENLAATIKRTMEVLRKWVATRDAQELFFEAQSRHAPYGWVLPIEEVAANPQLKARGWWEKYNVNGEEISGPGAPYQFSATPWALKPRGDAETQKQAILADIDRETSAADEPGTDPTAQVNQNRRPLEGLRILDFTHVLAGPFATRVLGDMGADVIKINSEGRAQGANLPDHPYYVMWNRNKRALALDLSKPQSREICRELCEQADVVIDNFSVGVLDRWGVGYETVAKTNTGVVYMQMSGMGDGGPWSKFVTYAPTIHALSGLTHLTGIPGREDIGIGFSYNDHQAGLHAAVAILAAIEARRTTGKGQRIDMSQFEVGVNFAGPALLDYFATGTAARPTANRLPYDTAAPHGCYPCAGAASNAVADERWVAIACMSDAHWTALKNVMGNPDWANSPGFESAKGRVDLVDSLDEHLAQWTKTQTAGDVMDSCQKAGVPAGIVQTAIDLAEHDPQLKSSGFLKPLESPFPGIGQTYADKLPLRFQKTPCDVYKRVRQIGEDNSEVLKDWLDMDDEAIEKAGQDGLLS